MPKTIALKGEFIRKEGTASGAVLPGDLLGIGGAADVQAHPAGGAPRKAFALENDIIGGGIDDAYAASETVQYGVFAPGCEVQAWLAAGQNAAKGAALVPAANGKLAVVTLPAEEEAGNLASVVAFAMEAVNNSAGVDPVRIKVEVA